MKRIVFITMMIITAYANAGIVNVTLENILNNEGNVRFAFFSLANSDKFPSDKDGYETIINNSNGEEVNGIIAPAKKGSMQFSVSIPNGTYAISAIHDEDSNDELNTVFLIGAPTEPYGFSNNARETFGPPYYKDAQFTVGYDEKNISIVLE